MLNSQSLEVAIGLVLVFLLFSLVLTAFREALEGALKSRAKNLERAIAELLDDRAGDGLREAFYSHPLVFGLFPGEAKMTAFTGDGKPVGSLLKRTATSIKGTNLPSYIPREMFSAVVDDLFVKGEPSGKIKAAYEALVRRSGGDPEATRRGLEQWYDAAMDRAAGWYKRRSQFIVFVAAIILAFALNINAVTIGRHLATNEAARAQAVQFAQNAPRPTGDVTAAEQLSAFEKQVAPLALPIGWTDAELKKVGQALAFDNWGLESNFDWAKVGEITILLSGFFIVGFAGMLGAPFWFDVLGKIMVVRSTVKPKEKSPDEASKDAGTGGKQAPPPAPLPEPKRTTDGEQEGEPGLVIYG